MAYCSDPTVAVAFVEGKGHQPFWTLSESRFVLSCTKGNQFATLFWNNTFLQLSLIYLCENTDCINDNNQFNSNINNDLARIKINCRGNSPSCAIFRTGQWFHSGGFLRSSVLVNRSLESLAVYSKSVQNKLHSQNGNERRVTRHCSVPAAEQPGFLAGDSKRISYNWGSGTRAWPTEPSTTRTI